MIAPAEVTSSGLCPVAGPQPLRCTRNMGNKCSVSRPQASILQSLLEGKILKNKWLEIIRKARSERRLGVVPLQLRGARLSCGSPRLGSQVRSRDGETSGVPDISSQRDTAALDVQAEQSGRKEDHSPLEKEGPCVACTPFLPSHHRSSFKQKDDGG